MACLIVRFERVTYVQVPFMKGTTSSQLLKYHLSYILNSS